MTLHRVFTLAGSLEKVMEGVMHRECVSFAALNDLCISFTGFILSNEVTAY